MYRHEKGGQMEKKILYNLLYVCEDIEEQKSCLNAFKSLPNETFDNETIELIGIAEKIHKTGNIANEKNIYTHNMFNKKIIDIENFFWDTNEVEARKLDLDFSIKEFLKLKEKEENTKSVEKALEDYKQSGDVSNLNNINIKNNVGTDLVLSMQQVTMAGLEKLRKIKDKEDTDSIKFTNNFFYLQLILKGIEPGELVIIAARPGVGKTAFMLALMNDISKQKKNTMVVTLEMTREEVTERLLTAKTGITRSVMHSKSGFTDEKFEELSEAAAQINKQPIFVVDEPPASFVKIKDVIREQHKKGMLDIVFIDYLGLIGSYRDGDGLDTRNTIARISRDAKLLAMELKIPIVLLQQVNRNVASGSRDDSSFKELQVTDLRDSGTLEQDANKIFLLWNKKPETDEEEKKILNSEYKVILNVAKNRNGQSNQKILFEFNHNLQRIKEIEWLTKPTSWTTK